MNEPALEPPPTTAPPAPPGRRYALFAAGLVVVAVAAVVFAARIDPSGLGTGKVDPDRLPVAGAAPRLEGGTAWLNSPPLAAADLAGKVVVYDFWTYSCVNCLRTLPHLRAWYERYRGEGSS